MLLPNALVDGGHHVLEVREDVGVRLVSMPCDQIAVDADVKLAMFAGNEAERFDALTGSIQRLTRHPGGSRRVTSMLAVFDLDLELFLCHHQLRPQ